MFITHLIIGTVLAVVVVVIHALALDRLLSFLEDIGPKVYGIFHRHWKAPMLTVTVLGILLAHTVEIWVWAVFYQVVHALPDFESSLYFSTSTFTTVGFGDIVLNADWRLISSFQSAIGFILFGWSTAFIFEVMTQLYKQDKIRKTEHM